MPDLLCFALALLPENLYMMWAWGAFLIHMDVNFLFFQIYSRTLHFFCKNPAGQYSVQVKLQSYTELRILSSTYNSSYGKYYIAPITIFQQLLTMLGIFVTIKFLKHLESHLIVIVGVITTLTTGSIMFLIVQFTGNVHEDSVLFYSALKKKFLPWNFTGKERLESYDLQSRQQFKRKFLTKLLNSYKTDAVKYGMFYDIKRVTSLETLSGLADMTMSALLSVNI